METSLDKQSATFRFDSSRRDYSRQEESRLTIPVLDKMENVEDVRYSTPEIQDPVEQKKKASRKYEVKTSTIK